MQNLEQLNPQGGDTEVVAYGTTFIVERRGENINLVNYKLGVNISIHGVQAAEGAIRHWLLGRPEKPTDFLTTGGPADKAVDLSVCGRWAVDIWKPFLEGAAAGIASGDVRFVRLTDLFKRKATAYSINSRKPGNPRAKAARLAALCNALNLDLDRINDPDLEDAPIASVPGRFLIRPALPPSPSAVPVAPAGGHGQHGQEG